MNKKQFEDIKKKWYDRLKAEGFADIENYHNEHFYNKAISPEAQEKMISGESDLISEIYTQLTNFYYNTNFALICRYYSVIPKNLKKRINFIQVEEIFLMYIEGEPVTYIAKYYNLQRNDVYTILKGCFTFAQKRSKSIKKEANYFIDNFSNGFSKKSRAGRKPKVIKSKCLECENPFYNKSKTSAYGYCGNCIELVKYAKGNKTEKVYYLRTTGLVIKKNI